MAIQLKFPVIQTKLLHRKTEMKVIKKNGRKNEIRSWQGSNLRYHRESDFKSDALTTRPQLL